jgi:hypothetical protein
MSKTARRTWQRFEGRAAAFFGVARRVLSGSANRADIDGDDATHPRLYIEAKLRQAHSACRIWDKAAKGAKKSKKVPVVALAEKNRPGFWLLIHNEDLMFVVAQYLATFDPEQQDEIKYLIEKAKSRGAS